MWLFQQTLGMGGMIVEWCAMMIWSEIESGLGPFTVTVPDAETLLSDIDERMRQRQGFSITTLNMDHVVKLHCNPAFHTAYAAQTHVTADGNPIVWLSRLAGQNISLIPGSELVEPMAALAVQTGTPVALVGTTDASLEVAAAAAPGASSGIGDSVDPSSDDGL
jgi:N-acetylglucosaminyldiphosphoundecaprenol N-acetyl-beta-D-mannosaminyltransferase